MRDRLDEKSFPQAIGDEDDMLLSALADNELPNNERDEMRRRLESDPELRREYEELRETRQQFKSYFMEKTGESVDLWPALEAKLRAEKSRRENAFSIRKAVSSIFGPAFDRSAFAAGFGVALVLVGLVGIFTNFETKTRIYATRSPESVSVAPDSVQSVDFRSGAASSHSVMVDNRMRVPSLLRQSMGQGDQSQLIGSSSLNGADIEWIRSEKSFRIMRPKDTNGTPIIWVVQKRQ